MNYDDMSDFEINKAVAKRCGSKKAERHCNASITESLSRCVVTDFGAKDYCNNPADMQPIMLRSGISTLNLKDTTQWIACAEVEFQNICMSPDGSDNGVSAFFAKYECYHTNPLRAAAIVFLKMQNAL